MNKKTGKNKKIIVLPIKKWQKFQKEKWELEQAFKAILAGEKELREGKTRSFEEFYEERHAK